MTDTEAPKRRSEKRQRSELLNLRLLPEEAQRLRAAAAASGYPTIQAFILARLREPGGPLADLPPPPTTTPTYGEARSKVVHVRFTPSEHTELQSIAHAQGVPLSDVVRTATLQQLRRSARSDGGATGWPR